MIFGTRFVVITLTSCVLVQSQSVSRIADLPENNLKLFNFFTGGLTELIWNAIEAGEKLEVSEECTKSIAITRHHIDQGSEWALTLLDASSKSPSGILEGTLTSYGDFEECLSVVPPNVGLQFVPKYCMAQLEPDPEFGDVGNITNCIKSLTPVFGVTKLQLGLCSLSLCSDSDVSNIVHHSLKNQPFRFTGDLTCQTKDENSWYNRIVNTTTAQRIGMLFILSIMATVSIGTTLHVAGIILHLRTGKTLQSMFPIPQVIDYYENFSIFRSLMNLITIDENESKIRASEILKLVMIVIAIGNQAAFLVETSIGLSVIHRLLDLRKLMSSIPAQMFSAQESYGLLFFVSGYVTCRYLCNRDLTVMLKAIASKYLRLGPTLACLVAFELIWPIMAIGPLYVKAATELVAKCSSNWWAHVVMCIPHTIPFSTHFQLFVLGAGIVFLLRRSPALGLTLSAVILAFATSAFYSSALSLKSPVMFDREPSLEKTLSYLEIVQRPIYGPAINYLIGLMVAHFFTDVPRISIVSHALSLLSVSFLLFSPIAHNVFNLVTPENYGNFVMVVKVVGCVASLILVRNMESLIQLIPDQEKSLKDGHKVAGTLESIVGEGRVVSLTKALIKLSFSMYLVSYFYIRYDYITTRILYPIYQFHVVKRIIYTLSFSWLLGVYFHLVFVSPFENIRKSLFPSK